MTDKRRALVLLVMLTLIWGTNWPLFPLAVREMSVWTFRAIAVPVSGLILLAFAALRGMPLGVPRADWPRLMAATMVVIAPLMLLFLIFQRRFVDSFMHAGLK